MCSFKVRCCVFVFFFGFLHMLTVSFLFFTFWLISEKELLWTEQCPFWQVVLGLSVDYILLSRWINWGLFVFLNSAQWLNVSSSSTSSYIQRDLKLWDLRELQLFLKGSVWSFPVKFALTSVWNCTCSALDPLFHTNWILHSFVVFGRIICLFNSLLFSWQTQSLERIS